jgi:hypothetical protein
MLAFLRLFDGLVNFGHLNPFVIPGLSASEEPGIHNHHSRVWILDLPLRGNPE